MPDLMTFRPWDGHAQCELCSANPAMLEFDIQCDQENSRQQGFCCRAAPLVFLMRSRK